MRAWETCTVALTDDRARELRASGLVASVQPGGSDGEWLVAADSHVGVVALDGWTFRVEPHLPVPRLVFLLAYAQNESGWRDLVAGFDTEDDLFSAVAGGFAFQALQALEQGPIRSYVAVEERATTFRGRVRVADQLARLPGQPLPLEIAYDDFSLDVRENQMLLGAAELLLRFPQIPSRAAIRLRHVRALLDEVTPSFDAGLPLVTRLNRRYEPALILADLILRHASVSSRSGRVESATFVFDLNRVFEDFLSAALGDELGRRGGTVRFQHVGAHLDEDERALPLKPDISWWAGETCLAVVDAKYKALRSASFPNADAYQMLAYCTGYRRRRGFLVYALDEHERDRSHAIRGADATICVRTVDVRLEPEALLQRVAGLASEIADGAIGVLRAA